MPSRAIFAPTGVIRMIARHFPPLPAIAFASLALAASAPAAAEDRAVEERLNDMGTPYEIDSDGDYKITVSWQTEKRSQIVFVSGKTMEVGGLTLREVFAPVAFVDKHKITGAKALALLESAGTTKLGGWEIRGGVVYFVVTMLDSMNAKELDAVVNIVSETADDKEIELTDGKDQL
jgi:hypothetical protein